MKPPVIYHGNCADGFSAAWCFWRKYSDGADYYENLRILFLPNDQGNVP